MAKKKAKPTKSGDSTADVAAKSGAARLGAKTANLGTKTATLAAKTANLGTKTATLAAKTANLAVLLCEDIEKLGWLGDVVEVKRGYARNYLIPQGLAKPATEANIKSISDERDRRARQRKSERVKLEEAMAAILGTKTATLGTKTATLAGGGSGDPHFGGGEGAEAVVAAKANDEGRLFGSVTAHEIATNLREQGFEVSDDMVQLGGGGHSGGIKEVGTHVVRLKFAEDLSCEIRVVVVAESREVGTNLAGEAGEGEGNGNRRSGDGNRDVGG